MTLHRLFVYGSLRPGASNADVLADVEGSWARASVRGHLRDEGWGAGIGYPGLVLDEEGAVVEGDVLTSPRLPDRWQALDEFEGEAYRRVSTKVLLEDGSTEEAYVYVLRRD